MTTRKKAPAAAAGNDGFSLISNEKLLALYAAMLRSRMLTQRIGRRRGGAAFGAGDEACVTGAVIDLRPHDAVSPPRGALTPCLLKGVPLKTIFTWVAAQPDALPARHAARRIVAPGADLAAQLNAALGAARRSRKAQDGGIVVVFGDCAQLARGIGLDGLRAAAAERLPVLFVCRARAGKEDFGPKARDYGLPGMTVDGEDVVAVYRVVSEAIVHARRGNGPTLIECKPWTVASRKKSARGGRDSVGNSDALGNMEQYLSRKGLFRAEHKADVEAEFELAMEKAAAAVGLSAGRKKSVRR
ncbi:MAG TPA: thiamine pyrophosphate-dependent enzyme [Terracidiphilus sp.]|jgi:TPP-dependent pyruvate/acetoin dehydrogenase alpha subunit|nr:thiamine pyrophosphate-dependent enzyme [Terracidiphilus sp.]